MKDILYITDLMEKNYESVGFIPNPRIEEYARRGQIFMEVENGESCGYLVFGNGFPRLRVYQACIQYDARRREHGLKLVSRLINEAYRRGCNMISLWCAEDLESNVFWKSAGFTFGGQRDVGNKRNRKHNLWVFHLHSQQQELFQASV